MSQHCQVLKVLSLDLKGPGSVIVHISGGGSLSQSLGAATEKSPDLIALLCLCRIHISDK